MFLAVIPAKAGIHRMLFWFLMVLVSYLSLVWVSVCIGMTKALFISEFALQNRLNPYPLVLQKLLNRSKELLR